MKSYGVAKTFYFGMLQWCKNILFWYIKRFLFTFHAFSMALKEYYLTSPSMTKGMKQGKMLKSERLEKLCTDMVNFAQKSITVNLVIATRFLRFRGVSARGTIFRQRPPFGLPYSTISLKEVFKHVFNFCVPINLQY